MPERAWISLADNEKMLRRAALGLVWLVVALSATVHAQTDQSPAGGAAAVFEKQCYSCHNIGGGDKKGPDLMKVTARRERSWLHRFIPSPKAMRRAGDRTALELFSKYAPEEMPDQVLTLEQTDQILAMIQELSQKNETFIPQSGKLSREPVPADIPIGHRLFTGQMKPAHGAPACIACHSAAGLGYLDGGSLGPDLTGASLRYKDVELASILKAPAFPTMSRLFANHELTDEEVVQLFAFLRSVRSRTPDEARPVSRYVIWSAAGAVGLFGLMIFVGRGRLRVVRRQLGGAPRASGALPRPVGPSTVARQRARG